MKGILINSFMERTQHPLIIILSAQLEFNAQKNLVDTMLKILVWSLQMTESSFHWMAVFSII